MHLLKNIGEMQSHIKQAYNPNQVYQKYGCDTESDTVKFMTQGGRVSDHAGDQYGGRVNAVASVNHVDAEFRSRKRIAGYFRAGAKNIHEDTGTMRHKRGKRDDHVFVHEIELERNNEEQDSGAEGHI